ncbi:hypothetical protein GCM10022243_45620 [Saccharothrix violaceirubra]|uniref:Uncharacterized protein n=1 Tax=Saccharothrix violaceirubra TaxID=413306 RepID=A0A7W7WVH7_9PSEU|nr:hypothetical protein [Saccharothrix violaceirubra]MBB4964548.1 hypothetical protein [Saccharothrix violaceirubra]
MVENRHGVALVERVLDVVREKPGRSMFDYTDVPWVEGGPRPLTDDLVFPSGRPLSPSLRAWMSYDFGLFERYDWFDEDGDLAPRPLDELASDEYGELWGQFYQPIAEKFPECFLLPGGSDSRRVLAVGEPDSAGEYPVLALDIDDMPFAGLMFPGFDVYAAHTAGLVTDDFQGYTDLADDPVYGPRMREHARIRFDGGLYFQ